MMMYTHLSPSKKAQAPVFVELGLVIQFHRVPTHEELKQLAVQFGIRTVSSHHQGIPEHYHCLFGSVPYAKVDEIIHRMNLETNVRKVLLLS